MIYLLKHFNDISYCFTAQCAKVYELVLFNTLTANYEYSRNNTDDLPLPVQMQLSGKLKTFSNFLLHFSNLH